MGGRGECVSWHFSQAMVVGFSEECLSVGQRFAPWKPAFFPLKDSCKDKTKDTCHRSQYGMMFVPSTDGHGEELLTWFRAAFLASDSATLITDAPPPTTFGPRCSESSDKFNREMSSRRMSRKPRYFAPEPILSLWDTDAAISVTTHGLPGHRIAARAGGFLATPTCAANQTAPSMQKHQSCRAYVATFGANPISPRHYEFLMGWPIGWTGTEPLAMGKYRSWRLSHGDF